MTGGVEFTLGPEPDLVPRVRRLARSAFERAPGDLARDAELIISELITNASLHGEPPFTVRFLADEAMRVEVEDAGRHLPVALPPGPAATTGRGLSLVAGLAARWGAERLPGGGKRVWAELEPGAGHAPAPFTSPIPAAEHGGAESDPSIHTVRLGPVPTGLLQEAEAHIEGVVRELSLLHEGEAVSGVPLPPEMAALVRPLTVDFADGRRQIGQQAAAAASRGEPLTELQLRLDEGAVEAGERYLAALDRADRSARAAHLLSLAAPPVHRLLREWCVGTAVEQLRALRAGAPPPPVRPVASVFGETLGRLAGMADAATRLTLIESVTSELSASHTVPEMAEVVVRHAVRSLGVLSARVRVVTPRHTLRSVALAGELADSLPAGESEIPLDGDLPGARVARTGQPLYVRSMRHAGGTMGAAFPVGTSGRLFPLLVDGQVLGVLSLAFRTGDLTDEAELSLAGSLAGILARAMRGPLRRQDAKDVVLELSLQAAGVGTFDWDLLTGRLVWDRQLLEIFGRPGEGDLTIHDFYDGVHPDDRDRVAALLDQAVATVGTYEAEYRVVLPDGRVRWVGAWGRALPGPDGSSARVLGVAQDTTERAEARDRIARIMDAWSTAFFFLDRDWRFTYLNAEAEKVLGRRADELVGRVVWDEFPAAVGSDFERWYRHAAETAEQAAFDAYYPEPLNAWYEVRAWPGPDGLAVYFLDITARRQAEERAARAISRVGLLAQVTEDLGADADPDSAMRTLAQLVVPTLADWCVVTLTSDEHPGGSRRALTRAFGWHDRPELRETVQRYAAVRLAQMADDGLVVRAVESAEAQVIERAAMEQLRPMFSPDSEAADLLERLAPESIAVFPLMGRHRPVGILSACIGAGRGHFGEVDLALLRDVAARAGIALDRSRLYRQQQEVAEALQRSMLTPPPAHGPLTAVRYVPAGEVAQVGGDWYDAFDHPDGARVVVIGDVVGHNSLAAAAMGQIRTLLRTVVARHGRSPAAALGETEAVMGVLGLETLATVVAGRIEGHDGPRPRLVLANAGHPAPLLLLADGTVSDLADGPADPLLGVGTSARHDFVVDLPSGSTVVLYTDGLVERRDRPVDEGRRVLADVLAKNAGADVESLCDAVIAAMIDVRAEDDVALMAVRMPA